jgi:methylenetetrahydrofolate--tRNA-(uracil-5-)-methyltransferase
MPELIVIGGGLAGCEAAWQAARRGISVTLFEMRPRIQTGAHVTSNLAELVCSNSLGSRLPDRAPGLLKEEIRRLGSLLLTCAEESRVPAGGALAVDRELFATRVNQQIENHPKIQVVRQEMMEIPSVPAIIASGPLTSPLLSLAISSLTGEEHLYFYDAIAPVVSYESIDMNIAFRASRYERGSLEEGDYINCPLTKDEYERFVSELIKAERIELRDFEIGLENGVKAGKHKFFEGCLPIEILARRGMEALAFGPMRPVGLTDPRNGRRPHAVVQLRQDNLAATLYNLVGFQTNLKFSEQKRIFRLIPGLEKIEFERFGQMHRNTYIFSPAYLLPTLQFRGREDLWFAGQITGVEGYVGNIATGLLAGWNASRFLQCKPQISLPRETILGALVHYIVNAEAVDFQPMKANFGILPQLDGVTPRDQRVKGKMLYQRSMQELELLMQSLDD